MRLNALRDALAIAPAASSAGGGQSISKLVWANWHRDLGELAMDVAGADGLTRRDGAPYDLDEWQRLFLFSRADTIYGGATRCSATSSAERVLGLPESPSG